MLALIQKYEAFKMENDEIVKNIENTRANTPLMVIPENLNSLKNGGRISPTVALIGNSIGIKPLIYMIDGALEKQGMVRNVKRTLIDKINERIAELYPSGEWYVESTVINAINTRQDRLVTLHYKVFLPLFNIEQSGIIEGYAH